MIAGLPILIAAILSGTPSAAGPAAAMAATQTAAQTAATLRPGQFRWYERPEWVKANIYAGDRIAIVVSRKAQRAYVFRGERLIAVSTVSTGSRGHETPLGTFPILQKKAFHRSNLYSDAPMPHMQRLTWSGIALHGGDLPGYPASHGCIRLPRAFAQQLYDLTALGGLVSVIDEVPDETAPYDPVPTIAAETDGLAGALARPAPVLAADMRDLGGGAFDVVTMRGDPPARSGRGSR